ncbi:hypothetical protein [Myxococcus sp. AS-1-15]|uniref:hypothetical protein n=1 Tax=Myxococcus sp. AS-1-15 TaxID=2874600 RepID=UPI001CBB66F7|nr:hypothetical protein [Myxococcus sp. AS-1-15]MBZ4402016.1 hypothetical protein [Myxococcus sp. AS-1-15]
MLAKVLGCFAVGWGSTLASVLALRLACWLLEVTPSAADKGALLVWSGLVGVATCIWLGAATTPEQWRLPALGWPRKESSRDV